MASNQPQNEQWQDCPAGELNQMVGRLNARQRQQRRKQIFTTAAACVLLVASGVFVAGTALDPGGPRYGGITCDECKGHFVAFYEYKSNDGPFGEKLAASMKTHLEQCQPCRSLFESTYPGVLSAEISERQVIPVFAVATFAKHY